MSEPIPTPPPGKKPLTWPLVLNLALLLLVVAISGGDLDVLPFAVIGLVVINGVAAVIMAIFKRLNYVIAFSLSALLLLLIGFGVCALLLSGGLGSMH